MLIVKDIKKVYKTKYYIQNALLNVSFELPSQGMVFITGKSGSGKSTLLNILGGIDKPEHGNIYYNNVNLDYLNQHALDEYRKSTASFIFQKFNLIDNRNVIDNIIIAGKIQRRIPTQEEISDILKQVDLEKFAFHKANQLSIGQQQRVAIARALIKDSKIIIADEPTSSLDSENSKYMFHILKQLSGKRLIIIASHDEVAAYKYGDKVINLDDGIVNKIDLLNEIENKGNDLFVNKDKRPSLKFLINTSKEFVKKRIFKSLVSFILTLMTIVFFGISLTMLFMDKNSIIVDNLKSNENDHVIIQNKSTNNYANLYEGPSFAGMYLTYDYLFKEGIQLSWSNYTTEISDFNDYRLNFIYGGAAKNYNQIVITDYIAQKTINEKFNGMIELSELIDMDFDFNVSGIDTTFKITVSGIIQTKYTEIGDRFVSFDDALSDSYYVKKGFMNQHLDKLKYAKGSFEIKNNNQIFHSYDLIVNDKQPTIVKKSKITNKNHLRVVTNSGIVNLTEIELNSNELIINLYYYNRLFNKFEDYITVENINHESIDFDKMIDLEYTDSNVFLSPMFRKNLVIKGIIFDPENELALDNTSLYDYEALNIMLSDSLFDEMTTFYHIPYKYLYNIYNSQVVDFFQKHYQIINQIESDDIIITQFDYVYLDFMSNMSRFNGVLALISAVFAIFSIALIYNNTSSNIESNKVEVGILRSLGLSRNNVLQIFFHESLLNLIIIIPLALTIVYLFNESVNKNIIINDHQFDLLKFSIFNVSMIVLYTLFIVLVSIFMPLYKLLRKTPVEIIRIG